MSITMDSPGRRVRMSMAHLHVLADCSAFPISKTRARGGALRTFDFAERFAEFDLVEPEVAKLSGLSDLAAGH